MKRFRFLALCHTLHFQQSSALVSLIARRTACSKKVFRYHSKGTFMTTTKEYSGLGILNDGESTSVHVYPLGTELSILSKYKTTKTIYYIRHAEGTHNVQQNYRDIANLDARLTDKGKLQCEELANRIRSSEDEILRQLKDSVNLIITSPLTRCMQTALLALSPVLEARQEKVKVIAHEGIRETVNYNCDRRRSLEDLRKEFGNGVDFSEINHDEDPLWKYYEAWLGSDEGYTKHRESAQIYKVAERGRAFFFDYLSNQSEEHIAICTHRAVTRAFFGFGHGNNISSASTVPQDLDDRKGKNARNVPIFKYMGDEEFADYIRADYANCELRSMILAFP